MHYIGNNWKRKFVTLMGSKVCATTWWRIHGIPKSAFHTYMDQYKRGIVSRTHGNEGIKCPQLSNVQIVGTVAAIIDMCTDQMSHQMRVTQPRQMDTLKYIPSGETWKSIRAVASEVCFLCS